MLGLAVVLVVTAYLVLRSIQDWNRLRHIRGPKWCGWSKLWLLRRAFTGSLCEDLDELCDQYGPLVRVAPNYLVCGDPAEVRRMWAVRSPFDRSVWYKGFRLEPPRDCTLSMRDNELHTILRSKLAPGYSGKAVEGLHELVDAQVANFIRLIETKYLSSDTQLRPVDFARKVQYLTLDVISTIAFGRTFGFVDRDGDLFDYIKTTEATLPLFQLVALSPWLLDFFQSRLFTAIQPSAADGVGLGKVMGIAKEVVAQRYGENRIKKPDMLGSFVANGLDQKDAEQESLVQIVAGSDTTATTLRIGMLHIATSPHVYEKLRAEIDTGVEEGRISSPITDAEARELPYLQACIKECFRIWPPVTGIMPRVSENDETVCGQRVPAGTNVGWSARSVLRDKGVFGENAELYWPDRWLSAEGEKLRDMDNTVELVFGRGKWGCLGKPISLLELNKVFVELLRRFDFVVVNPSRPMKTFNYGVTTQSELFMKISRRENPV